ncbi:uncharacterized protein LOC110115043 [Dendrobium catenatum]|uniref:Sucrose synthase 7 n=1 Tax=Dendrobium catenatum TaxID=906689 RepID=A0A2I0VQ74_9ASPA|nr:uncharacterized protein LOC110115043 [Dendrobium catenatum]XP_028556237.1 uncharacterized protein LOC110115043 [Dendrobium catenatum]PKU65562.1 Sucrose synthase 7 [Dendrobium catenatum]
MEEPGGNGDFRGNVLGLYSILALGRGSRKSPSFRRFHSGRTPLRDSRSGINRLQWLRSQRVVFCLILIALWAYVGFHVQSRWAHGDHRKSDFVGYKSEVGSVKPQEETAKSLGSEAVSSMVKEKAQGEGKKVSDPTERLAKSSPRKRGRRMLRRVKPKPSVEESADSEFEDVVIPTKNNSFGLMVGPFGETENRIVGLSPQKRKGKCDREGEFAGIVWTRSFVLVFHELSMTGAPLSMMELATEILSCGGNVKVVALSKKGGLMWELARRGIEMIEDKADLSFKAAMKADLVIAGSAVSSSWIEQYLRRNPAGSSQLVWWIMENRQEYFNRSKHMLSKVKTLIFLSDTQSKQWLSWCEDGRIELKAQPMLVPLSVNDDLAFLAGIPCSLNTPVFTVKKMMEKRDLLRSEVRKKMGLSDNDMLVMSLSSINPAKGQLLLFEAARLVAERNVSQRYPIMLENEFSVVSLQNKTSIKNEKQAGALHSNISQPNKQIKNVQQLNSKKRNKKEYRVTNILSSNSQTKAAKQDLPKTRSLLSESSGSEEESLKVLVGSVGSKSNKAPYVKAMLRFLSQNSKISKLVLWTRATTHVASLYAAADVYVINAQGLGETFGRVTIEAMAFGLPVLGTDAGGTREIVKDKVTGLLHPVGHEGSKALAQSIRYFINNPSVRKKMGMHGRQRVQEAYLKQHTYGKLAKVIAKCLKVRQ